jgi:hypothetical protein
MGILLIAVLFAAPLAAAPATVEGSVLNLATGAGVKKAVVTLRANDNRTAYQAISEATGHFRFDDVAPGEYQLSADAQGFVREVRLYVASRRVTVSPGQPVSAPPIRLTPFGTISGRVLDENGDPIPGATIFAVHAVFRQFVRSFENGESVTSDARGEYRLFDIEPGPWLLKVRKRLVPLTVTCRVHNALPETDYPDTYRPGASAPVDAEPLLLAPGAHLTDIDLRLRKVRVYHIRGKVTGAASASIRDLAESWTVQIKPDATFDIAGFAAGRYRLVAESDGARSAVQEVTVQNRDVEGVEFQVAAAIEVAGTVEGIADKPDTVRVWLEQPGATSGSRGFLVRADGGFVLLGLAPQAYRVSARPPDGMYLKSVRLGPRDVSDTSVIDVVAGAGPLTLGFASDTGSVAGTAVSDGPSELPIYVIIVPTGTQAERLDRVEFTQVEDASGAFELYDIPPGEYQVLACETADASLPQYPGFRKLFEGRSETVTVRPGERATVRLKVISAADAAEARTKLR